MEWIVPQLSEQEFEIEGEIIVVNVQSYPVVGGEWKVRFLTTGTEDLTITAIDGTTFGESFPSDLKFLDASKYPELDHVEVSALIWSKMKLEFSQAEPLGQTKSEPLSNKPLSTIGSVQVFFQ